MYRAVNLSEVNHEQNIHIIILCTKFKLLHKISFLLHHEMCVACKIFDMTLTSPGYCISIQLNYPVVIQESVTNKQKVTTICHIAITNCPFRFAFSHLPGCGQLLRQKHKNLCVIFLWFSDSSKPGQSITLIYKLAWLAGIHKSEENLLKTSCKVAPVTKVAHKSCWRHDNRKQSASASEHWCDVTCDIPYLLQHQDVFLKHWCPRRQQSQDLAKSLSPTFWPPPPG